jgi:hypothetical protein
VKFFDLQVAIGGLLLDLAGENADQPFQSLLFPLSYKGASQNSENIVR